MSRISLVSASIPNINNLGSKIEDFSENIFNTVKQEFFGETIEKKDDKQEDIYCEYCGSLMSGDAKKCPNCSASVKKKK